jgi:uncharacterized protein YfiM (DUF2279 family)
MEEDKKKHYAIGYKFGRYGSVLGFIVLVFLAGGKEVYDAVMPNHHCEWKDFTVSINGAWDGMMFKRSKLQAHV